MGQGGFEPAAAMVCLVAPGGFVNYSNHIARQNYSSRTPWRQERVLQSCKVESRVWSVLFAKAKRKASVEKAAHAALAVVFAVVGRLGTDFANTGMTGLVLAAGTKSCWASKNYMTDVHCGGRQKARRSKKNSYAGAQTNNRPLSTQKLTVVLENSMILDCSSVDLVQALS